MAEWESVAYALQYEISIVRAIKHKHEDPKLCCRELLKDWLTTTNGTSPKTWATLLNSIKKIADLRSSVEEIEHKLG